MAATFTLIATDIDGAAPNRSVGIVAGKLNFGSTYAALADADLLALVNTALAAVNETAELAAIKAIACGLTANNSFVGNHDPAAGEITLEGLGVERAAETLAVTSHLTPALADTPIGFDGVEILAGSATGVCTLTPTSTPAATKQAYYDHATNKVKFNASDAATSALVKYSKRIEPPTDVSNAAYSIPIVILATIA